MMHRSQACDPFTDMSEDDLLQSAELFVVRGAGRRSGLGYHRFPDARDAIAFAVEEFPSSRADGVVMVVGDKRFDLSAIRSLHRLEKSRARTESVD
jgi:hypothetical protein